MDLMCQNLLTITPCVYKLVSPSWSENHLSVHASAVAVVVVVVASFGGGGAAYGD